MKAFYLASILLIVTALPNIGSQLNGNITLDENGAPVPTRATSQVQQLPNILPSMPPNTQAAASIQSTLYGGAYQQYTPPAQYVAPAPQVHFQNGGIFIPSSNPNDSFQTGIVLQPTAAGLATGLAFGLGKLASHHKHKQLASGADRDLYCVGFQTYGDTGRVLWVDPACQLYGYLQPGDTVNTIDGERVLAYTLARHNYANADVPVTVNITNQNGITEDRSVRRILFSSLTAYSRSHMFTPF
jgi:hypothetical protein